MPVIRLASVNYLAYKNALKQAWKDGKMSADESAMLDTLRKSLNISAEEHMHIEHEVRNELAGIIPMDTNSLTDVTPNNNDMDAGSDPAMNNNPAMDIENLPVEELLQSNDIKQLLTAGKNSYHKGNYEEAIEFCDKVLLLNPDNSEALFFRKRTLSKIEKMKGKKGSGGGKKEPKVKEKDATKTEMQEVEDEMTEAADIDVEPIEQSPEMEPAAVGNNTNGAGAPTAGKEADPNCKSCAGSGQCHWCQGSGKCYWCKGSGNCDKCKGEGQINGDECKSCKGSGKCHSCNGDSNCYWCKGSGKCSKCSL
jgi:hypothetical protein